MITKPSRPRPAFAAPRRTARHRSPAAVGEPFIDVGSTANEGARDILGLIPID
jgi:hypothetical protein